MVANIQPKPFVGAAETEQCVRPEGQHFSWLTAREAAQYLSVEPRTVLVWARQGKVRGFKLSGTKRHVWRFRHSDLDAMLIAPSVALRTKGAQ